MRGQHRPSASRAAQKSSTVPDVLEQIVAYGKDDRAQRRVTWSGAVRRWLRRVLTGTAEQACGATSDQELSLTVSDSFVGSISLRPEGGVFLVGRHRVLVGAEKGGA